MSDDKIAEIRARHSARSENDLHGCYRLDGYTYQMTLKQSQLDLATALAEVDRQRAGNERLCNEDTKTRHALKGWVFVCPDGGDEPTHERVAAVVAEVEKHRAEIERLREALRWYADPRNHFPVERRSPGAPDPAVIFVEEPPIMLDGGERARRALEGKP